MRKYNVTAIVLKNSAHKDADKLFTMLSQENGKIIAIAKGVRKITSRRSGSLDTLNKIKLAISQSDSGFKFINEVQLIESFPRLKKDYEKVKKALYLAELVNKTVFEEIDSELIYNIFEKSLQALNDSADNADLIVSKFELNLLKHLGYGVDLNILKEKKFAKFKEKVKSHISLTLDESFKSLEM
ncbi:DNA repair protein RecO [candidate division WWE3 bacterium RIFOXYC1_FULL_40_10]|uniref:DNA repair protein RecO n=1 Tax=candidate division WWE3 bacterium RIFOXYA2_FULL_46_9 TaxID=1802636 RepID=A0A1F4W193_UNCKA|nr:MAG: DNA repair protein RecO [candidate division WWE3 bacterium RIFOXYB1_FULL_40_22]OGC61795.1 MAG: DNA repair protein RecO [candidate division WWE3 bacterium RIFOXYA1_FULL_40_11]OGC62813.1 MAG: DNA repair protein RecO [candidate division WWE3 bacterium RIFOXYA2_FULL_46_9]OGC65156.1 MAG: DNA repair protein RecO [candidate division WWE3 bacterium RIFOXYB2_FULL_41_6]OGC66178.1 MAG: DNA repair protein RecO [candidate division WWE3 bacterium RIFOXYC1_FULL_40_10]OGC67573.1 MAG: DNA repair protei